MALDQRYSRQYQTITVTTSITLASSRKKNLLILQKKASEEAQ